MPRLAQKKITVNSSTWTAVTPTIYTQRLSIGNIVSGANDINRRIDSADAETEILIPTGTWYVWDLKTHQMFESGVVACYLKSVSGSFDVVVEYIA
jgi:hypothetical protein